MAIGKILDLSDKIYTGGNIWGECYHFLCSVLFLPLPLLLGIEISLVGTNLLNPTFVLIFLFPKWVHRLVVLLSWSWSS